jgi:hypothetical protein
VAIEARTTAIYSDTTAIEADTTELQGDWVNGGRLDLLLDGIPKAGTTHNYRNTDTDAEATVEISAVE